MSRRTRLWEWAEDRHVPLATILVTIGLVAVTYLAGKVLYRLRDMVLIVLVAGFVAVLLDPIVVLVGRAGVTRRGYAVGIVTVVALLVFIGLAFAFGYPLVNGVTHFAKNLPKVVSDAQHGKGWIGSLVRKYHLEHWVRTTLTPKLTSFAQNLGKPALTLGKGAVNIFLTLFAIFVLVILLLVEAPKVRRGLLRLTTPERGGRWTRIAGEASTNVTRYMAGNTITSIIAGVVVFVTLTIMGVPYPQLWAIWVALVDYLPMVGGALAGIPTVFFALFHSLSAGIVTAAVFLAYTQIENHVLNPIVMSKTVRISPLVVFLSVVVGANIGSAISGSFGGFVGTLLAIPLAASIQMVVHEVWQSTAPEARLEGAGSDREGTGAS